MEDADYVDLKIRLLSGAEHDFRAHKLTFFSVLLHAICEQLGLKGAPMLLYEDDDIFDTHLLRLRDVCDREERFTLIMQP